MKTKKHYVIDVKSTLQNTLKIGGVYHSEKEVKNRIKELQEGGWLLQDIEVKTYIQD